MTSHAPKRCKGSDRSGRRGAGCAPSRKSRNRRMGRKGLRSESGRGLARPGDPAPPVLSPNQLDKYLEATARPPHRRRRPRGRPPARRGDGSGTGGDGQPVCHAGNRRHGRLQLAGQRLLDHGRGHGRERAAPPPGPQPGIVRTHRRRVIRPSALGVPVIIPERCLVGGHALS
jgi:hypothetical protein